MPKKQKTNKVKATPKLSEVLNGVVIYRMTYIWSEPTTKSKIQKIVVKGTILEILDETLDDWSKVRTVEDRPIEGYIQSVFIDKPEG